MAADDALTRRGMLVLLGAGGVMAGVTMTQISETEPTPTSAAPDGPAARTGPRFLAAVTAASRSHRTAHTSHAAHLDPADQSWSDVVRVELSVENVTDRAALLSPGQFRLRLDALGLTVAPLAAGRSVGPLAPGAASRTWIDYLAPAGTQPMSLEFTDQGRTEAVSLPVRAVSGGNV